MNWRRPFRRLAAFAAATGFVGSAGWVLRQEMAMAAALFGLTCCLVYFVLWNERHGTPLYG